MTKINEQKSAKFFPPVVAVLGHVDHGKTSLLDAIRKTSIATREHGGITQAIGASSIEIMHERVRRQLTFIDTPGHEAFAKMRGRGAIASDLAVLVVSAADGVMPQTKESIQILQQLELPFIVALTKADLENKNSEKVKQQLLKENVLLEGYGGDVPVIEVSSRTNFNIKELLDLILLYSEMHLPENAKKISLEAPLQAIVIESTLDPRKGPKATIVIKNGAIRLKDEIAADGVEGRVRALTNDKQQALEQAAIGQAVEILGFKTVPKVGSIVIKKNEAAPAKTIELTGLEGTRLLSSIENKNLSLLLVADTQGSLEAIVLALPSNLNLILQKTGDVSEADVLLAKSTGALILTFNLKIKPEVLKFALNEKILLKNYSIIYELLDEVKEVVEGKRIAGLEQIFGTARILATFPFEKSVVLGIDILDGRIAKGDKIRLIREEEIIGESSVISLRQGKNTASKVEKGQEAGIMISPMLDFKIGDMLISHS